MLDLFLRIIEGIFILLWKIISFIFSFILSGFGKLIEQLTIKIGMMIVGVVFISYIAAHT